MIALMRKVLAVALIALGPALAQGQIFITDQAKVRVETSMGDFVLQLDAIRAPLTVQNFLQHVVNGHYDGTVFHRIVPGFVIQGGGYTEDLKLKPVEGTVFNESGNGLSNLRGTVGMARGNDPHSGDAQFYINLLENANLNPRPSRWGYAVFGEVIEGMDVVDLIGSVPTGAGGEFDRDVPIEPIIIERITLIEEPDAADDGP